MSNKETKNLSTEDLLAIALQKAKNKLSKLNEPIAIIGMSCEFPGAEHLNDFWALLSAGREGVQEIPKTRFDIDKYYNTESTAGKIITRRAGFIEGIDLFDAQFFAISPKEAEYLDPQQRLLLTHTWLALEHAGIAPTRLMGSDTGVFVGICTGDYGNMIQKYGTDEQIDAYFGTGTAASTASGRISYTLGLQGPNIALDTACSSSLVALNEACERLQRGECSLAIVGGVNALLLPDLFINFSKAGMLAPDGKCKTFDESANGYVRGEGCGVVIVKRLSDAQRDNDPILAVIKASGINQDGASSGLTVPNGQAQERLLTQVLAKAKLTPKDIDYVECHGTGTSLGDPIEVHALGQVYGRERDKPLLLGSVKTNIGHLEAAAGVAGLIKVVLALNHQQIPKHLNFKQLNPHISLNFPAEVVTQTKAWPVTDKPRRAAISSFGFSGTNAHVILEEAPEIVKDETLELPNEFVFILSAKSKHAADKLVQDYILYLQNTSASLADICYTAATGRTHFNYRLAVKAQDKETLIKGLQQAEIHAVTLHDGLIQVTTCDEIIDAYLTGKNIDWQQYYQSFAKALHKIPLPTYPFDKKSFWIDIKKEAKRLPLYEHKWIKNNEFELKKTENNYALVASQKNYNSIKQMTTGSQNKYFDFSTLELEHLQNWLDNNQGSQVIFLADTDNLNTTQAMTFYQRLFLIIKELMIKKVPLTVVTRLGQAVTDEDIVNPFAASLSGFIRSCALEHPDVSCRLLDIDNLESHWLAVCFTDFTDVIALRSGAIYSPKLVDLSTLVADKVFNPEGCFLITGGLGDLGLIIAEDLINHGVKNLCLVGRRAPSEKALLKLNVFRQQGVELDIEAVDVSNAEQVNACIGRLKNKSVPLVGVIHAAGMLHDGLLTNLDWEDFAQALPSKVLGAWNLHQATQNIALSYFILFSSISSSLGSPGQTNYAMANAFLDGLAHLRRTQGLAAISINWGAWDTGMAERGDEVVKARREQGGLLPLHHETAMKAFHALLTSHKKHVLVAEINWTKVNEAGSLANLPLLSNLINKEKAPQHYPRFLTLQGLSTDGHRRQLMQMLQEHVAAVLGMPETDIKKEVGFFDLGIDSLMALDLRNRLQQDIGEWHALPASFVVDYSSLDKLYTYFEELLSQQQQKTKVVTVGDYQLEPIAVIGMDGIFPGGCENPEALWHLLINNQNGIEDIPATRWDIAAYYDKNRDAAGKMYVRKGGFLKGIELFDADFFNISPKEALFIDPQQRLILQTGWHALEDSGISPESLRGSNTGFIVGCSQAEYSNYLFNAGRSDYLTSYTASGGALSGIAGRFAYALDLQGPCMTVDTACSSSLVAIHNACEALRSGNADLMLAGGVNLTLTPEINISLCRAQMLAEDGHCKTFDARANGYVRSEGCAVVVLKRLSDAQRDNDPIYGVILASTVNQDGASGGLTVPNRQAQEHLMQYTLAKAHCEANQISYVEAHGTGTALGDPIEIAAIKAVYGQGRAANNPLIVSALKSHVGHLEAAAGIGGLMKVLLSFKHQQIPGVLHFNKLNPKITLEDASILISNQSQAWPTDKAYYAAVSAFGFTGTNAHAILTQAPKRLTDDTNIVLPKEQVFVLSAKSRKSLEGLMKCYVTYLDNSEDTLADICYTVAIGRSHFNYRIALVVSSKEDLQQQLHDTDKIVEVKAVDELAPFDTAASLVNAYLSGYRIDWLHYYRPYSQALRKLRLPTYRFDAQRYWIEIKPNQTKQTPVLTNCHPLLQNEAIILKDKTYTYTVTIDENYPDFVKDHQIYGEVVIAGATYVSAMMSFVFQVLKLNSASLIAFEFVQPLVITKGQKRTLQLTVKNKGSDYDFEFYSISTQPQDEIVMHANGTLTTQEALTPEFVSIDAIKKRCPNAYLGTNHQAHAVQFGLGLGPHFHWLDAAYYQDNELLAVLREPTLDEVNSGSELYPGLVDASFQTLLVTLDAKSQLGIPVSIDKVTFSKQRPKWVHLIKKDAFNSDITYLDANGLVVARFLGFNGRIISQDMLKKVIKQQNQDINLTYQESYELFELPVSVANDRELVSIYASDTAYKRLHLASMGEKAKPLNGAAELNNLHIIFVYEGNFMALVALAQQLITCKPLSFTLITTQAFSLGPEEIVPEHTQALGFWKSLSQETSLPCYLIDIQRDTTEIGSLLALICNNKLTERQLIVRDRVYVPRLVSSENYAKRHHRLVRPEPSMYLESRVGIETLHWAERKPKPMQEDEVTIQILATALNFRDVLKAMHLYPGEAGDLGYECVGKVLSVGNGVDSVKAGDKVIVTGTGLFGSQVIVKEKQTYLMPEHLTPEQGASIPIVFLTADYCLNKLAHLKKGQKVLIHAATGGVGLAAIALAQLKGATVYATTSLAKQAYLKDQLRIKHVYDSRTLDFGQQILADTNGEGVDVILNSLTGEGFIEASLACLNKGGTFLEMSKLNIYTQAQMQQARPDVHYYTFALDELMREKPDEIRQALTAILALFNDKKISPLPITSFPITKAISAFDYLQRAQQIGKVVIANSKPFSYSSEATYLITGGTGGLGLGLANHLIEQGVKHLVLTSRSKPSEEVQQWITLQDSQGVTITHHQLDVADKPALHHLFAHLAQGKYPLKGIFHVAGLLKDERLTNLNKKDFDAVFAPKVLGSSYLDELSRDFSLDCFVLFSSFAAVLGNLGQSNYAAANAFMDGLAIKRHQHGLPALSVNWGPFAKVGMAANLENQHHTQGLTPLDVKQAFVLLDHLMNQDEPQVAVVHADWSKINVSDAYLTYLLSQEEKQEGEWLALLTATPVNKREQVLESKAKEVLAEVLSISNPNSIESEKGFFDLGMDSLIAMDLKNRLQHKIGTAATLHSSIIFNNSNIKELTEELLSILNLENNDKKTSSREQEIIEDIKNLDSSEIDELINSSLK